MGTLVDYNGNHHSGILNSEALSLIEKLTPDQAPRNRNGSETWSVTFSNDNSHFAWSCGHRTVIVLPWNSQKNRPVDFLAERRDSNDNICRRPLIIECDDHVWSMAFGSSKSDDSVFDETTLSPGSDKPKKFYDFNSNANKLILAVGLNNGRIRIYSVFTGKCITELVDHKDVVRDVQFAPDGSLILLSASRDGTLKLWDLNDDGNMFKTLKNHVDREWVMCCAWAPNAKYAASGGSQNSLFVYNTEDWSVCSNLKGHHHSVVSCRFSPDCALLASSSYDTTIILWDFVKGEKVAVLWHVTPPPRPIFASGANDKYVRHLSFSPDGEHIASVCDDGNLRIWSIFEPDNAVAITAVPNAICTSYSADGCCLSVGTREGNVHLFASPMRVQTLKQISRKVIRRFMNQNGDPSILPLPNNLKQYVNYRLL